MINIIATFFLILAISTADRYVELNEFERKIVTFTDSIRVNSENLISFMNKDSWINTSVYKDEIYNNIKYLNGQEKILKSHNCFEYYLRDISTKKNENKSGSLIRLDYSITVDSFNKIPKSKESPFNSPTTIDEYDISYDFLLRNDSVYFEGIIVNYHFPLNDYKKFEEE